MKIRGLSVLALVILLPAVEVVADNEQEAVRSGPAASFEELGERLSHDDPAVRAAAVLEFRKRSFILDEEGRRYLPEVLELVRDHDSEVRKQMLGFFRGFDNDLDFHPTKLAPIVDEMTRALLELMATSASDDERSDIWDVAELLQPPATPTLAAAMGSDDLSIRLAAAEVIYNHDQWDRVDAETLLRAEQVLVTLFMEEDPEVAKEASWAIQDLDEAQYPGLTSALLRRIDDAGNTRLRNGYLKLLTTLKGLNGKAVPYLTEILHWEDEYQRTMAVEPLGEIGQDAAQAIPSLRKLVVKDGDVEYLHADVLRALPRIDPSEATMRILFDHLEGPDYWTVPAIEGLAVLGSLARPATERLLYFRSHRSEPVRAAAETTLESVVEGYPRTAMPAPPPFSADPRDVPWLIQTLRSDDLFLRRDAVKRLRDVLFSEEDIEISLDGELIANLDRLLIDEDPQARHGAANVLRHAVRLPIKTLTTVIRGTDDSIDWVRTAMMVLLREASERQIDDFVTILLESEELDVQERRRVAAMIADVQLHHSLAVRMRRIPDVSAPGHPRMPELLGDSDRGVRRAIALALRVPDLIDASRSESGVVRRVAVWALQRHSVRRNQPSNEDDAAIVHALAGRLEDQDREVRRRAALALGSWLSEGVVAIPHLRLALADDDRQVRIAAGRAIRRIDAFSLENLVALLTDERSGHGALETLASLYERASDALERLESGRAEQSPEARSLYDEAIARITTPVRLETEVTPPVVLVSRLGFETRLPHEWPKGYWPIRVEVVVDPEGRIDEAVIIDGFDGARNDEILRAFNETRFEPARDFEGNRVWVRFDVLLAEEGSP